MERRFCEIDLRGDPDAAAADINRYLARDRMSNRQAARSAERTLRDSNREAVDRRAVIQSWSQVVGGLDEGLVELVATAAEQSTGHRPQQPAGPPGTLGEPCPAAHTGLPGRRRVRPWRRSPVNTVILHPGF